jgi:hypothetical protein
MDAKEALRRYLEQRRELGESELVLDSLTVEDAMRMLGAANLKPGTGAGRAAPVSERAAPAPDRPAPVADVSSTRRAVESLPETADWRAAIRAAGGTTPNPVTPRKAAPDALSPEAKVAAAYLGPMLARKRAVAAGADDVVLLDYEGNIAESPISNVFAVSAGVLWTPPLGRVLRRAVFGNIDLLAGKERVPRARQIRAQREILEGLQA